MFFSPPLRAQRLYTRLGRLFLLTFRQSAKKSSLLASEELVHIACSVSLGSSTSHALIRSRR